jgi:hypothetical protein
MSRAVSNVSPLRPCNGGQNVPIVSYRMSQISDPGMFDTTMNAYFVARSNVTHASRVTPTPYDGYTKALSFNLGPSGPNASIVTKPLRSWRRSIRFLCAVLCFGADQCAGEPGGDLVSSSTQTTGGSLAPNVPREPPDHGPSGGQPQFSNAWYSSALPVTPARAMPRPRSAFSSV